MRCCHQASFVPRLIKSLLVCHSLKLSQNLPERVFTIHPLAITNCFNPVIVLLSEISLGSPLSTVGCGGGGVVVGAGGAGGGPPSEHEGSIAGESCDGGPASRY